MATIYTDGVHVCLDIDAWIHAVEPGCGDERLHQALAPLHYFAAGIGLRREWLHRSPPLFPHYDLTTPNAAERAIRAGAVLIGVRDLVHIDQPSRPTALVDGKRLRPPGWVPTPLHADDLDERVEAVRIANITLLRQFAPGRRIGRAGVHHLGGR